MGGELRDESHSSFATYLMAQSLQAQSHRDIRNRHDNDAKRVIHIHGSHTDIYGDYVDTHTHTHVTHTHIMSKTRLMLLLTSQHNPDLKQTCLCVC